MSLNTINSVISSILADTNKKIGEALIERAAVINSMFDDAYGSCLGGHYASGMECAAAGLRNLDDLLDYADSVMSTADAPVWEWVRDALGTVRMEKAPLEKNIVEEYNRRIKRYVSPTFGDHPKQYITTVSWGAIQAETNKVFQEELEKGTLIAAELDTLGATYHWDKHLSRWVLDCLINPEIRPHLAKYM